MNNLQRSHVELKNIHKGEDIWVVASGPSMNFVSPDFFDNKISIGVNRVNMKFDCDYLVAKDPDGLDELQEYQKEAKLIFSKWAHGNPDTTLNTASREHWVFDHVAKLDNKPDVDVIGTDFIVVSYSTITSALHLAAYMGAKNLIICGHDCGAINGMTSIQDYYKHVPRSQKTEAAYFEWLGLIESHTIQLCESLKSNYDVNIHSLNPFINLNLEGNHFEPSVKQVEVSGFQSSAAQINRNRFDSSVEQFRDRLQEIAQLEQSVADRQSQITQLEQSVADGQSQITQLEQSVADRQSQITQLEQSVADGQSQITDLLQILSERELDSKSKDLRISEMKIAVESYQNSWSWRITQPIRFLVSLLKRH